MIPKGYKHSEETKLKISNSHKGLKKSWAGKNGFQKGHHINKGKKLSEEHKRKLSESHKNKKLPWISEMMKKRKGEKNSFYGKHHTQESIEKNKKAHLGKKHTEEWKKQHSKRMSGENHPNWQGGKTFEEYTEDWTSILKESIRQRDNYVCQECGIHQDELEGWQKKLDIHHIDYDKKNCNPNNLITLCVSCHRKTNFNRDYWRDYWIDYFQNYVRN